MRPIQYPIKLTRKEQHKLEWMTKKGQTTPRILTRVRVLLLANDGINDTEIMIRLEISKSTCVNLRRRFQTERLAILSEKARPGRPIIFDGETRAKITALACSETPDGRASWSYQLLADKAVELGFVERIHKDTVGEILKKMRFNHTESEVGV